MLQFNEEAYIVIRMLLGVIEYWGLLNLDILNLKILEELNYLLIYNKHYHFQRINKSKLKNPIFF